MAIKLTPERNKLFDEYDHIRRKGGGLRAAKAWLKTETERVAAVTTLQGIANQLQDPEAKAAINNIIVSGDIEEMHRIIKLLTTDKIEEAIKWQGMTEDSIREKAKLHHIMFHESELALRRRFRKQAKKAVGSIAHALRLVGGKTSNNHVTKFAVELRNDQKSSWRKYGEAKEMHKDGQSFRLIEMMKNQNRCSSAEAYKFTTGLESYAKAHGETWAFLTLTAPPQMHPNSTLGKDSWDGTEPEEAYNWLMDNYQKVEARLRTNHEIVMSGVRVVEPHKDGCPHLHMMIFAKPEQMGIIEAEFRKQPNWEDKIGMKFERDNGKAKASSYLFKYIQQTTASIEELCGELGTIDAWRSIWGMRAFAFIGLPPKALWRDLRALKICPTVPLLSGLWHAAHRGDMHAFIGLAGGLNVKTKDRPVISRKTSDKYSDDKQFNFIINETKTVHTYTVKKWQRRSVEKVAQTNENKGLGLNHSYPSKTFTALESESPAKISEAKPQGVALKPILAAGGSPVDGEKQPRPPLSRAYSAIQPVKGPFRFAPLSNGNRGSARLRLRAGRTTSHLHPLTGFLSASISQSKSQIKSAGQEGAS